MQISFDTAYTSSVEARALIALLTCLHDANSAHSNPSPKSEPVSAPASAQAVPALPEQAAQQSASEVPEPAAEPTPEPIPEPTTRRRGRPSKAEVAKAVEATEAASQASEAQETQAPQAEAQIQARATVTAVATEPITAEKLRELLNGFIAKHSMEEAIEVLKSFGCNRVSEAVALEPAKLAELAGKLNG